MERLTAVARGRLTIRPWRVGVLTDTASAGSVREAIANLSSVWGGCYMPIFDTRTPVAELEALASEFDVDSLYAEEAEGPLEHLLRSPGWNWPGKGEWGPFSGESDFRTGLLPTPSIIGSATKFIQPEWDTNDQADLLLVSIWGITDKFARTPERNTAKDAPRPDTDQLDPPRSDGPVVGAIRASRAYTALNPHAGSEDPVEIYIVRLDHAQDVVAFWNMRASGAKVLALPATQEGLLSRSLLDTALQSTHLFRPAKNTMLRTWRLENASSEVADALCAAAQRHGATMQIVDPRDHPRMSFRGLRTSFDESIRSEFQATAQWVDLPLPKIPLEDDPWSFSRGIVATEVEFHAVDRQDPRFTATLPPYRQHSALLRSALSLEGVENARVTQEGYAFAVMADNGHVRVPFAYNQAALNLLFGTEEVKVSQSEIGKFQSRAAEKFGGPFSGTFNQPGVRSVILRAATKPTGLTMQQLRRFAEQERGNWPDPIYRPDVASKQYAHNLVDELLHSGIFVPTLRTHGTAQSLVDTRGLCSQAAFAAA